MRSSIRTQGDLTNHQHLDHQSYDVNKICLRKGEAPRWRNIRISGKPRYINLGELHSKFSFKIKSLSKLQAQQWLMMLYSSSHLHDAKRFIKGSASAVHLQLFDVCFCDWHRHTASYCSISSSSTNPPGCIHCLLLYTRAISYHAEFSKEGCEESAMGRCY